MCIAEEFPYKITCGDACGECISPSYYSRACILERVHLIKKARFFLYISTPYYLNCLSMPSEDGTLIVTTRSDGTYFLFTGKGGGRGRGGRGD